MASYLNEHRRRSRKATPSTAGRSSRASGDGTSRGRSRSRGREVEGVHVVRYHSSLERFWGVDAEDPASRTTLLLDVDVRGACHLPATRRMREGQPVCDSYARVTVVYAVPDEEPRVSSWLTADVLNSFHPQYRARTRFSVPDFGEGPSDLGPSPLHSHPKTWGSSAGGTSGPVDIGGLLHLDGNPSSHLRYLSLFVEILTTSNGGEEELVAFAGVPMEAFVESLHAEPKRVLLGVGGDAEAPSNELRWKGRVMELALPLRPDEHGVGVLGRLGLASPPVRKNRFSSRVGVSVSTEAEVRINVRTSLRMRLGEAAQLGSSGPILGSSLASTRELEAPCVGSEIELDARSGSASPEWAPSEAAEEQWAREEPAREALSETVTRDAWPGDAFPGRRRSEPAAHRAGRDRAGRARAPDVGPSRRGPPPPFSNGPRSRGDSAGSADTVELVGLSPVGRDAEPLDAPTRRFSFDAAPAEGGAAGSPADDIATPQRRKPASAFGTRSQQPPPAPVATDDNFTGQGHLYPHPSARHGEALAMAGRGQGPRAAPPRPWREASASPSADRGIFRSKDYWASGRDAAQSRETRRPPDSPERPPWGYAPTTRARSPPLAMSQGFDVDWSVHFGEKATVGGLRFEYPFRHVHPQEWARHEREAGVEADAEAGAEAGTETQEAAY